MQLRLPAAVLLAVFCFAAKPSAASTLEQRLVGTWRIVLHQEREGPEGKWRDLNGSQPSGYLIYDETGHMSLQIATNPRPRFTGKDGEPTRREALDALNGYLAYFGTYTVNETTGVVTHHVESSLWPDYVGTDQERPAVLEGNRLTLSDGKTWRVVWTRVSRSSEVARRSNSVSRSAAGRSRRAVNR